MSYIRKCPHGHQYEAADYYHDWPFGLSKCPDCRAAIPPTHTKYGDWFYNVSLLEVGGIADGTALAEYVYDREDEDEAILYKLSHCNW